MKRKILPLILVCSLILALFLYGCLGIKISDKNKAEKEKEKETTASESTKETKKVPELKDLVELDFEPNPVQPNKALTIRVVLKMPEEKYLISGPLAYLAQIKKVIVHLPGASSASKTSLPLNEPIPGLEGTYFWYKANDRVELNSSGKNEWIVGCVAPTDESLYPAEVILVYSNGEKRVQREDWILKVFPEMWDQKPGANTPEEAVMNELKRGFGEDLKARFKIEKIVLKDLLPHDKRDTRFLKLYMVTFTLLDNTPVLTKGTHTQFFYVLRESPDSNWKVLSSGSSP
jgi:hypothetical protein